MWVTSSPYGHVAGLLGLKGSRVWDNYPGRGIRPFEKYIMLYACLLLLSAHDIELNDFQDPGRDGSD